MTNEQTNWTCALTGHRILPKNFDEMMLYEKLEEVLLLGCTRFYCGMAQGFDLIALGCLINLRRKYRFTIEACVPYRGYEKNFPFEQRKKYDNGIAFCDRVTVLFEKYSEGCFFARDRYMVDHADAVLSYCKKMKSGTGYTTEYAIKKGVPVIFID